MNIISKINIISKLSKINIKLIHKKMCIHKGINHINTRIATHMYCDMREKTEIDDICRISTAYNKHANGVKPSKYMHKQKCNNNM